MMLKICSRGLMLALLFLGVAPDSEAKSFRVNQLPNGRISDCATCHVSQRIRGRNPFGLDVEFTLVNGNTNWAAIYFLDSDGDGYSNGRELGDPCGEWRSGRTPERTTNISNPGDPSSVPPGDPGPTCQCGNGIVDPGEECDDGNLIHKDSCTNDCKMTSCGNGIVDDGELCDDGNEDNTDDCLTTCERAKCGDGFIWTGNEACDDGNRSNSDACLNTCTIAQCGDGFVLEGSESCDNGADNSDSVADACRTDCTSARCGDGVTDSNETCDDGSNLVPEDNTLCTTACPQEQCGNGIIEGAEGCDNGADNSDTLANGCRTNCQPAGCGDFVIDSSESCDDGPAGSGQCSPTCELTGAVDTDPSGCSCQTNLNSTKTTNYLLFLLAGLLVSRRRHK